MTINSREKQEQKNKLHSLKLGAFWVQSKTDPLSRSRNKNLTINNFFGADDDLSKKQFVELIFFHKLPIQIRTLVNRFVYKTFKSLNKVS